MNCPTMDTNTLTTPALLEAIQSAMVTHLDSADAVIDPSNPMQRAAYQQGCAVLQAAALQAAATTHAADTVAAALDRLAAALTASKK